MTLLEFLNYQPNQRLQFSDEKFYAYGDIFLNCNTGEPITLNTEETLAKQLNITEYPLVINDKNGNQIYYEDSTGFWWKREYNENGQETYYINSYKEWQKREYDANGVQIRFEDSVGYWWKREFDAKGNQIRYDDSNGYWGKQEFDAKGNVIYYEDSDGTIKHYKQ
jgi:hypothetical protein